MTTDRRYRLTSWLVRCLLPDDAIGTYVLWDQEQPVYAGRSDTSLRRRLIEHARVLAGTHFTFNVIHSPAAAFDLECSLYHALPRTIRNQIHPDRPEHVAAECSFCRTVLDRIRSARLPAGFGLTN